MGVDRLRIQSNQRVDLDDFQFLTEHVQDGEEQLLSSFAADPAKTRKWIVDGFAMDNPAASQLRVTLGRAILGYRVSGVIQYGALTVLGDTTKTVDIAAYGVGDYGIYVRFESVAGDAASRIFWNPAGAGSEYAQTVHTRYKANWSVRVEATNPGDEWTKIGSVDQASMDITDEREFFFEGAMGGIIDIAAVFTWNNTTTIAATGADTSELSVGDWICLKSDGYYFEISAITPNVDLTILNPTLRTIPAGAGTSAKSAINPYLSGWSTEGGGAANDRSMDRAAYAVADLQTGFATMRQCIEDIKGRNLRKWWEKNVGGLNIGFDTDPILNKLAVKDANFHMTGSATVPTLGFDDKDYLTYTRASNRLGLFFNDVEELAFEAGVFYPFTADGTVDLGKAGKRFGEVWAVDIRASDFFSVSDGVGEGVLSGAHFVPSADGTTDLGNSAIPQRWRHLYLSGNLIAAGDLDAAGGFATELAYWYQENVVSGQTDADLYMDSVAAWYSIPAIRAGSVIGIAVHCSNARTAGSCIVDVTVNGVETGMQATLDAANPQDHANTQAKDVDTFTASQLLGVSVTTDGAWAAGVLPNIIVTVLIEQ